MRDDPSPDSEPWERTKTNTGAELKFKEGMEILHGSSATPLTRLPSELISQIFEYTLPDKPSFSPSSSPLALTQICRQWRAIALKTPRIWGKFLIPDWQELPANILELVRLWVSRSAETPLDIDISLFNEDVMMFPDKDTLADLHKLLREMLELLEPHRGRILRFRGVFPEFLMKTVGVPKMLNAEHIYYCGMLGDHMALDIELEERPEDQAAILSMHTLLDVGPQRDALRSLAICGCAADINSVMLQTQLTHLELLDLHRGGELCQETAFMLLTNMPRLKNCILDLTKFERQDWVAPERRLVLQNMELLFISWVFPADIDSLLQSITAPKLDKLGLRGTPMVPRRPWTGLYDFLEASKAPISRISLGDFASVDAQYLRCFAHLPNLVHLTINHAELPDVIFRTLTCGDALYDHTLLPNLQVFNMGVCEGFRLENVVNFLKSRAQNPPEGVMKLRETAIMYCTAIEERHKPVLQECGVENLIVEAAEDESVYPYARVVETHRELLAVLYQNAQEDELPPFPNFDEEGEGDADMENADQPEDEDDNDDDGDDNAIGPLREEGQETR
ncbi:hypothetical protein A7U60_g6461 [Sanghuangporus baumii]|uniref:F-box domain-containing protein n=1 Tax=Sanghuangporus baumii TaxID=108892 RepID=A0A9Q5N1Z9_SANBA|nr:hypothetical protein A7U60_g6461 [Sanghuangporus baumii]